MDWGDMPLLLYGWRPSWIWPKKRVKGVEKFEPYDFCVIWSLTIQYPPLTQFGQTNLANSIFVTSQPPLYSWVYIWCCKYGENRYCERCANKKWCASKHTGLLNSCLGKLCLLPYLVVPLISAIITLISTRVSAHCHAILFNNFI